MNLKSTHTNLSVILFELQVGMKIMQTEKRIVFLNSYCRVV